MVNKEDNINKKLFLLDWIMEIVFYLSQNIDLYRTIEVIFRTSAVYIFGFLLSSNTKNVSEKNKDKILEKMAISVDKENAITEECKVKKETYHYYGEGNTVQVMVALLISIISALVMLGAYTFGFVNDFW